MSSSKQVKCDCGCGRMAYHSQLTMVTREHPVDDSLRQTATSRRFWVTRQCKKPFEEELVMMEGLNNLVKLYPPPARTRYWLINAWLNPFYPWPRLFRSWCRRVKQARKVMQLQHAIFERPKGFEYAHDRALKSALLFGCPGFMQNWLMKRFIAQAEKEKEDATSPELTVVKT